MELRHRRPLAWEARLFGLAGLVCLLVASDAAAQPVPLRTGFTMEFGIGVGAIQVGQLNAYGRERMDMGFEPHAVSFGGFIRDDLALLGRWKSTYHTTPNSAGEDAHRFLGTLTFNVQWWFRPRWFVSGGAGGAAFGYGFGSDDGDPSWSLGGALTARVGYVFARVERHAFKVSLEAVSGVFGSGVALGETLNLEWQYF